MMRLFRQYSLFAKAVALIIAACCVSSCRTPRDVTYFSNINDNDRHALHEAGELKVMPDDRLSIVVTSKDPQLASLFNLPIVAQRTSQPGVTSLAVPRSSNNEVASYVVDSKGDIQFPVLGPIHIGGMKRDEVAAYIRHELVSRELLKDAVVIVDFLNRGVSVLGEVTKPGRVTFDRDKFTLLDALAQAGDLTINGKRTDVLVMRRVGDQQTSYRVDLTDAGSLTTSPVYYLQQDDVIYVSPNDVRKRQTTANGNAPLTPSFWISIASLAATIAMLIFK